MQCGIACSVRAYHYQEQVAFSIGFFETASRAYIASGYGVSTATLRCLTHAYLHRPAFSYNSLEKTASSGSSQ